MTASPTTEQRILVRLWFSISSTPFGFVGLLSPGFHVVYENEFDSVAK